MTDLSVYCINKSNIQVAGWVADFQNITPWEQLEVGQELKVNAGISLKTARRIVLRKPLKYLYNL